MPNIGNKEGTSPFLYIILLVFSKFNKERKDIQIGKEKSKTVTIVYVEKPKHATKQLLKLGVNLAKSQTHVKRCMNIRHYSHYVKEARHKNPHHVLSHSYKILEQTTQRNSGEKLENIMPWRRGLTGNEPEETCWRGENVLYIDRSVEHLTICIYQNSLNSILRVYAYDYI